MRQWPLCSAPVSYTHLDVYKRQVYTLIVKGDPKEAEKVLLTENPTIVDVLPLTLEEIFIYELGGVDYEVKDILL